MYTPAHFDETRAEVLRALIRGYPLATLITHGEDGLAANPVPLQWFDDGTPLGCLQGHVARANPLWRGLIANADVLAVFSGPQAYVSPSWYATKREHGRVVPTWNYVVVQAHGALRAIEDKAWLRGQLERLTGAQESALAEPWALGDAPPDYLERLFGAIVGIELGITRLSGKWKLSQNQPAANRTGVVAGLLARDVDDDAAMARLVSSAAPE